jgi:solute carrier family 25 phosphate transporter 23/24/25/41
MASASAPVSEFGFKTLLPTEAEFREVLGLVVEEEVVEKEKKPKRFQFKGFKLKVGNASLRRLISGAFAGAVSRTAVAPLETIRTHLMVGTGGKTSVTDMFNTIMERDGWQGLFRGNGVNVLRVAPSKAIELLAYDTVKTFLTPKNGEPSRLPVPASTIAGATAGVCSTLTMYPLELLKTRLTVEHGMYDNLLHAFLKICKEEGPMELYRGLLPSLIGVIPYAAMNYCTYDSLRKTYRRVAKRDDIGNLETLLMGSIAGAVASSASFPLEVARKQMQVGNIGGRQVYSNVFQAMSSIVKEQGPAGLYRGLGASCIKIIPAAGISFMCYEACKRVLVDEQQQAKVMVEEEKAKVPEATEENKSQS